MTAYLIGIGLETTNRALTKGIDVLPGDTKTVIFEQTKQTPVNYTVELDGQTGEFTVVTLADLRVYEVYIRPESILQLGDQVDIEFVVANRGEAEGTFVGPININGVPLSASAVNIPGKKEGIPGEKFVSFPFIPDKTGTYEVEVYGEKATFRVVFKKLELSEAVNSGLIQATVSGAGMQSVGLEMVSTSNEPLCIIVLPMTMFISQTSSVQNMMSVRSETTFILEPRESTEYFPLEATCVSMDREVPSKSNRFTIVNYPPASWGAS